MIWLLSVLLLATSANPEVLNIDLAIDCDNHDVATGAHEPIQSWWGPEGYDPADYADTRADVWVIYSDGTEGVIEAGITTPGYHDSWLHPDYPIWGHTFTVILMVDDTEYARATATCEKPAPPPSLAPPRPKPKPRPATLPQWIGID